MPHPFNCFLEHAMSKDSENFEGVLSVRGSNIGNLSFEDDVDLIGGMGPGCANTMTELCSTAMMYGMEIRTKKEQCNDNEDY